MAHETRRLAPPLSHTGGHKGARDETRGDIGSGTATRLLAEARAFFLRSGIKYFTVFTAVANQAAIKFYERNGMTPLHTTLIGETKSS